MSQPHPVGQYSVSSELSKVNPLYGPGTILGWSHDCRRSHLMDTAPKEAPIRRFNHRLHCNVDSSYRGMRALSEPHAASTVLEIKGQARARGNESLG